MDTTIIEAVNWANNRLKNLPSIGTQNQYVKVANRMVPNINIGKYPGTADKKIQDQLSVRHIDII